MNRTHRSLVRRAKKIDADEMADKGDDYLEGLRLYRNFLKGVPGLKTELSVKNSIKKIDQLEKEIARLEDKIDKLAERKAIEAAKLEEKLATNLEIVKSYLTPVEYRDFLG